MLNWPPELYGRSLLRIADLTDTEMLDLIDLAVALKARRRAGVRGDLLKRRQVALIFEKALRARATPQQWRSVTRAVLRNI